MVSLVSENVVDEKLDVTRRFERRSLWKFLPVVEVFVAVVVLLSWLQPNVSAGEYLRWIVSGGFSGGIFLFGVVNVLIALIFSLSNDQKLIESDLYFQYVSTSSAATNGGFSSDAIHNGGFSSSATPNGGVSSSTTSNGGFSSSVTLNGGFSSSATANGGFYSSTAVAPPGNFSVSTVISKSPTSDNEEKNSEGKPEKDSFSVTLENTVTTLTAVEAPPMRREMTRTVSSVAETAHTIRKKREMTFLPPSTTDHQVYRRSRSERFNMRGDFGRSMIQLCDIDDLSNDEFNSTVEMFIEAKKKMLSKERRKP